MDIRKKIIVFFIPFLFLIFGVVTIPDYGINWDEPLHFNRGQAYLHFFLTGQKNYDELEKFPVLNSECAPWKKTCLDNSPEGTSDFENYKGNITYENAVWKENFQKTRRSYFQNDSYNFEHFINTEDGHPPLNDILAALTNKIFFQEFKVMGDIESHHLFEVITSFLLVLIVAISVYKKYGLVASTVSALSLSIYPLYFAESHFNIKDPVLASFFGLTILFFYFGVVENNFRKILASALFCGLSLGTKFNTVFILPVIGIWFIVYLYFEYIRARDNSHNKNVLFFRKYKNLFLSLFIFPVIVVSMFIIGWPFLWENTIGGLIKIIGYYKQIGMGTPNELSRFLFKGWNLYPLYWIMTTTQLSTLFLFFCGLINSLYRFVAKKDTFALLVLLWFFVPIFRVSCPGANIYGGVRQIMEFIPAMAIIAGIGAKSLFQVAQKYRQTFLLAILLLSGCLFSVYEMIIIHPNQNVYFNQLVGGLSGAKEKSIPYWGNSYGNAYNQGVLWLNNNAEKNAKLGLLISTMGNVAKLKLRSDIDFWNGHWSGPKNLGEYSMELYFDWTPVNWYSYAYYDTFLDPVYQVVVQGVPILKVWKNDPKYIKPGFEYEKMYKIKEVVIREGVAIVNLGEEIDLTKIVIEHSQKNCQKQKGGFVSLSLDGKNWKNELEAIDYPQVPPAAVGIDDDTFVYLFAAKKAKFLKIDTGISNSCILNNPKFFVYGLGKD